MNKKIKVALIIDELFGAVGTAFGGYGFLARRHIAKYIPNDEFQVDILLGKSKKWKGYVAEKHIVDGVNVYNIPKKRWFAKRWIKKQNYDVYLSIELVDDFVLRNETNHLKKLVLWIQDPRPLYEWDEINTVKLFPETSYYNQKIYDLVNKLYKENRVKFISQGLFLNQKAKDLYKLNDNVEIQYLPNPIDIDHSFNFDSYPKKDQVIFLGRIESVKRGWLFCEIARKMPEYQFYMLGQTFRESEENSNIMSKYLDIPNLHFVGHVDGIEKEKYLKDAKILVNTSIHEALPISFLEALSYGTLLVSNRDPENLTSQFGIFTGDVLGDGFDKVDLFVDGIKQIMNNDALRREKGRKAIEYIKTVHNIDNFITDLRNVLRKTANNE
ncbi:glycosyltransferase family 4 protein [Ursidibacter sp. B-7004-1]